MLKKTLKLGNAVDMESKSESVEAEKQPDKLTTAIGEFGRWQIMLLVVVVTTVKMSASWQQLSIIFLAQNTTFTCLQRENSTEIKNMTCYDDCVEYKYYTKFENTIISEWGLICKKEWLANFTQTVCMFGVMIGSIVFGFTADRYGRRTALLSACMLQLITTMIQPFCPNYVTFAVMRFFVGSSSAGTMLVSFILIVEMTGPRFREMIACLTAMPISVGEILMTVIAYYLRAWNKFCLGVAIPNLFYLIFFFVMPESPKWLISMGRLEEASVIMTSAAKWNRRPAQNMMDVAKCIASENQDSNPQEKVKATYLDLLKTARMGTNILCSCIIWFILGISFYGSNQYIGQSSSNTFLSVAIAGAMQLPGIVICNLLCKYCGRRITHIGFFVVCAVSNALVIIENDYVKLVMGSIGVSCAAGAFSGMYMYTTELFPTVTRNMAMGASSTVSRVGSMLAPYVAGLSVVAPSIPPTAFAIVPLIAAFACFCLPETKGKALSDHIEE